MYVCPTCEKLIENEATFVKHFLACWKEHNPNQQPKPAPQSPDVETKSVSDDIQKFFERKQKI